MGPSNKSRLAINLKKLMGMANISEHELSRRTNIAQPIINRIIKGENQNPKLFTLKPIADYFMLTISQLIGEKEIDTVWDGYTSSKHEGWHEIPLTNWEQAVRINQKFKTTSILNDGETSEKAFAYFITNEGMDPIVPKNSIVVIEPELKPKNGELIALKMKTNDILIRNYIQIKNKHFAHAHNNNTIEEVTKLDNILGTVIRIIYDPRIKS